MLEIPTEPHFQIIGRLGKTKSFWRAPIYTVLYPVIDDVPTTVLNMTKNRGAFYKLVIEPQALERGRYILEVLKTLT